MPTITAILLQPRQPNRLALYVDGAFVLLLNKRVAEDARLSIGSEVTPEGLRTLGEASERQQTLEAAYRFLAYRPRSESEVRTRLRRRQFPAAAIEATVVKLREQRLLDDEAFASQWAQDRVAHSPRSRSMLRWELRQKGVEAKVVQQAVEEVDETEAAYAAASKRAGRMNEQDYRKFLEKLGEFLHRRGFGYELSRRTVERVWQELGRGTPD